MLQGQLCVCMCAFLSVCVCKNEWHATIKSLWPTLSHTFPSLIAQHSKSSHIVTSFQTHFQSLVKFDIRYSRFPVGLHRERESFPVPSDSHYSAEWEKNVFSKERKISDYLWNTSLNFIWIAHSCYSPHRHSRLNTKLVTPGEGNANLNQKKKISPLPLHSKKWFF